MSSRDNTDIVDASESNTSVKASDGTIIRICSKTVVDSDETNELTELNIRGEVINVDVKLTDNQCLEIGNKLVESAQN